MGKDRKQSGNQAVNTQRKQPAKKTKSLDELRKNPSAGKYSDGDGFGLPKRWQDPVAILLIFLSLVIFFGKVLDKDHTFNAGDNIASESFKPFLDAAEKAGTDVPQWMPNIFCGMPAFAALVVTGERTYDVVHEIFDLVQQIPSALFGNGDSMAQIWHYFILGLGMYLLLRVGRKTSWLSALFGAFSAVFSTWIITYVMIGHNTKIFAIMTMPFIFLAVEKLRTEKMNWQRTVYYCAILGISVHFLLESTHIQMAFYIFLALLIYFVYNLVADLIKKSGAGMTFRAGLLTVAMVALAFSMSADRYVTTLGYQSYSIRGSAPIVDNKGESIEGKKKAASSTEGVDKSGGLDWNYATQWSFSPGEMITFIAPAWFGYGEMSVPGTDQLAGTYYGQMPFTDCANYTGIVVFTLAIIGIFVLWKRDRLVAPLAIISLFALLLSFGNTFPILFSPMFHFFPMFNKFRAPSMALVLMQLSFPIIAALMVEELFKAWKNRDQTEAFEIEKYFKYGMYVAGVLLVIFLVGRGGFEGSIKADIAKSGKQVAQYPSEIADYVASTALNDAAICMAFALIVCAGAYFFLKNRMLSPLVLGIAIFVLSAIDLWRVDYRRLDVTTKTDYENVFQDHDYVSFIKQDKSLYRILDLNSIMSNVTVSWGMQTIAGYHAAKMREYQDVVDITGDGNGNVIANPYMWNLLNTKYIIANGALTQDQNRFIPVFQSHEQPQSENGKPGQPTIVWANPQVLPRVVLVSRYEVKQPLDMLHAMHDGTFNPRDVLFFDKEPQGIGTLAGTPVDPTKETAEVTSYKNESVDINVTAAGDRLLFMSDTWYPDWSATIDGKPTTIYKADYAFRAIKVPAGTHKIAMTFYDSRYAMGRTISLIANILALAGLIVGVTSIIAARRKPKTEAAA